MTKTYVLLQVMKNPRDGSESGLTFGEYPTLGEAVKVAKRELKDCKWAVVEQRVVRVSDTDGGDNA